LLLLAILAPGALAANLRDAGDDSPPLSCSWFGFAALFYAAVWFVVDVLIRRVAGVRPPQWGWAAVWALGLLALIAVNLRRMVLLKQRLREMIPALACVLVLLQLCTAILIFDQLYPFDQYRFEFIAGPKTYGYIYAHDNYFQFVNGRAIAEDEPFSKYYGNARLTYPVTSREMLPGVVYSVFRHLLPGAVRDSYLLYTLLGISFELTVVFPLVELARRRLGLRRAVISIAGCFGTSFFLVNAYYTWYKFAGTALFVAGLLPLLEERRTSRHWAWAGFFWGIGTNMHAGVALAIPVFLCWAIWTERSRGWARTAAAALLLVGIFTALNAPWNAVKRRYLQPDAILFEEHFLHDTHNPRGVAASIREFFATYPIADQLAVRTRRVLQAVRFREIGEELRRRSGISGYALAWDRVEMRWALVLFFPLLLFAIVSTVWPPRAPWTREEKVLLGGSAIGFVLLLFGSYGRVPFDITWALPYAVLAIPYVVLVGRVLLGATFVRIAFYAYLSLSWLRVLYVLFFVRVTWP